MSFLHRSFDYCKACKSANASYYYQRRFTEGPHRTCDNCNSSFKKKIEIKESGKVCIDCNKRKSQQSFKAGQEVCIQCDNSKLCSGPDGCRKRLPKKDFYGRLTICKACTKKKVVAQRRQKNIERKNKEMDSVTPDFSSKALSSRGPAYLLEKGQYREGSPRPHEEAVARIAQVYKEFAEAEELYSYAQFAEIAGREILWQLEHEGIFYIDAPTLVLQFVGQDRIIPFDANRMEAVIDNLLIPYGIPEVAYRYVWGWLKEQAHGHIENLNADEEQRGLSIQAKNTHRAIPKKEHLIPKLYEALNKESPYTKNWYRKESDTVTNFHVGRDVFSITFISNEDVTTVQVGKAVGLKYTKNFREDKLSQFRTVWRFNGYEGEIRSLAPWLAKAIISYNNKERIPPRSTLLQFDNAEERKTFQSFRSINMKSLAGYKPEETNKNNLHKEE